MNFRHLIVGLFVLYLASHVFASCASPSLSIAVPNSRWYQDASFDVNLSLSADPPPTTTCTCPFGQDCGLRWQYFLDSNSSWVNIPSASNIDLNCSGNSCSSRQQWPAEDVKFNFKITCATQKTYQLRGFQPFTGTVSSTATVYCYPSLACTPPSSGDFNLNQTCNYQNVPLILPGNFTIQSSGRSIHNNSDVIFRNDSMSDPPPASYLNIQNGGRIDLNHSALYAGLTKESNLPGGIMAGFIGVFFAFYVSFRKKITESFA